MVFGDAPSVGACPHCDAVDARRWVVRYWCFRLLLTFGCSWRRQVAVACTQCGRTSVPFDGDEATARAQFEREWTGSGIPFRDRFGLALLVLLALFAALAFPESDARDLWVGVAIIVLGIALGVAGSKPAIRRTAPR